MKAASGIGAVLHQLLRLRRADFFEATDPALAPTSCANGISVAVAAVSVDGFVFSYGVLAAVAVVAVAAAWRVVDQVPTDPIDVALARTEAIPAFE